MANYNTPLQLFYKGYRLHKAPVKGGPQKASYILKVGNYHLPRKFEWTDKNNLYAFRKYVDALVRRDVLESQKYEDAGFATNHEFEQYDEGGSKPPLITISPMRLAQIIFAEDPLELPANTIVRLRSSKSDEKSTRFVAQEFVAELASEGVTPDMLHALAERVAAGLPISPQPFQRGQEMPATERADTQTKYNKNFPVEHPCNNSGANLTWAAEMEGQRYEPPKRAPRPSTLERVESEPFTPPDPEGEHYIDVSPLSKHTYKVLSVVHAESAYFVKRIMHIKGFVLLTQTSWSLEGPWHTAHIDRVELAAEGLTLEDAA